MGIKNKQKEEKINIPMLSINYDERDILIQELKQNVFHLIEFVNNHSEAIRNISSKMSEISFKIGKIDQETHANKTSLRILRDKLLINKETLITLGIFDETIFNIVFEMIESKNLPILSDGKINAEIILSRYNHEEKTKNQKRILNIKRRNNENNSI